MSHVVNCGTVFKDLDVLEEASKVFGYELRRNQTTYKWFGKWVADYHDADAAYRTIDPEDFGKCAHAIVDPTTPEGYEIGVVKNPDEQVGGYLLIFDFYGPGQVIEEKVGKNASKLCAEYGQKLCAKLASKLRHKVDRVFKREEDGKIQMDVIVP